MKTTIPKPTAPSKTPSNCPTGFEGVAKPRVLNDDPLAMKDLSKLLSTSNAQIMSANEV